MTDTPTQRELNLSKCPKPYMEIAGAKMLIYPDEADDKFGSMFIPETAKKTPQVGIVVQVGGGFASDLQHDPDGFRENCPYKPGDKVIWSAYDVREIDVYVHRDWWTEEDIASMKSLNRERKVTFQILELGRVIGLSTAQERVPIVEE